ncbi:MULTISPECIES: ABC transporter substrate-binding protein [Streptomyces]|uniref:ABC transporter substrate-binding protein n=1 Tax=Streptomyces venezuelae TaxID=54571 RepID=A0A5P2BAM8_STRVZ|nr:MULTISPECIES: ABC transporter substrate-binding protein [Streptomyces]NEA02932.1 ABC transporter substrate-binding protein [Streptomyces sp. SID10116]MYY85694.1 ABC transporter substrate-binding protein [Streptomyces sp. SID335]MYZ15640.1 ABC transporter substrate-binding protein [Streptomyces sp. SID337]NDZ88640.1 ABC transporter substrate-binding protein [Streptomyces sp. SID10115]NEB44316.1 ABC transporter substrate-binding protein [Streptomyces sp. SID339]
MRQVRLPQPSRRGILAAGGALGLTAALAACGTEKKDGSGKTEGGGETGPWSFKDDRGQTAKRDAAPKNIVAFTGVAAALFDYGIEVKGVFGPTTTKDGKADVQAGDMDVSKLTVIGNAWGQFNIEKYAGLAPDVLISTMFDDKGTLWYVPEESKDKILKLAPSVGISVYDRQLTHPLQRIQALAESLGADVKADKVVKAKKRFEDASERLRKVAKAHKDIKVLVGSASQDLFYVSGSNLSVDLEYFKALGVNLVEPSEQAKKESGGWFENLSWENVDKYRADIIMMDNRTSAIQPADISKPTWKKLPAVKAGQVIPRIAEPIFSYDKCAPILEDLADAIEKAKKLK